MAFKLGLKAFYFMLKFLNCSFSCSSIFPLLPPFQSAFDEYSQKFLLSEMLLILRAESLFRKYEDENFSWIEMVLKLEKKLIFFFLTNIMAGLILKPRNSGSQTWGNPEYKTNYPKVLFEMTKS